MELSPSVNRDVTNRVRPINGIACAPMAMQMDITCAIEMIKKLDKRMDLYEKEEELAEDENEDDDEDEEAEGDKEKEKNGHGDNDDNEDGEEKEDGEEGEKVAFDIFSYFYFYCCFFCVCFIFNRTIRFDSLNNFVTNFWVDRGVNFYLKFIFNSFYLLGI